MPPARRFPGRCSAQSYRRRAAQAQCSHADRYHLPCGNALQRRIPRAACPQQAAAREWLQVHGDHALIQAHRP